MYDYIIDLYPHTLLSNKISRISIVGPIVLCYLRASYCKKKELSLHCLNENLHFFISVKNGFLFYEIVSKTKVPEYK